MGDWVQRDRGVARVTPRFLVGNSGGGPLPVIRDPGGGSWGGSRHPASGRAVDAVGTADVKRAPRECPWAHVGLGLGLEAPAGASSGDGGRGGAEGRTRRRRCLEPERQTHSHPLRQTDSRTDGQTRLTTHVDKLSEGWAPGHTQGHAHVCAHTLLRLLRVSHWARGAAGAAPGLPAAGTGRAWGRGGASPEHSPLEQQDGDDDEDDEDDGQDGARHPQHLGLLLLLRRSHLHHDLVGVGAGGVALLRPSGGTAQMMSPGPDPHPLPPTWTQEADVGLARCLGRGPE